MIPTMATVGAFEAKTHLAALLDRVARGERITITRHGVPVADLIPAKASLQRDRQGLIDEIKRIRKGNRLRGLKIRALIEEGRRF